MRDLLRQIVNEDINTSVMGVNEEIPHTDPDNDSQGDIINSGNQLDSLVGQLDQGYSPAIESLGERLMRR